MKTMKNILLIAITVLSTSVFAQKLGHINSNDLLLSMPERNSVEQKIKTYAQELENQV